MVYKLSCIIYSSPEVLSFLLWGESSWSIVVICASFDQKTLCRTIPSQNSELWLQMMNEWTERDGLEAGNRGVRALFVESKWCFSWWLLAVLGVVNQQFYQFGGRKMYIWPEWCRLPLNTCFLRFGKNESCFRLGYAVQKWVNWRELCFYLFCEFV